MPVTSLCCSHLRLLLLPTVYLYTKLKWNYAKWPNAFIFFTLILIVRNSAPKQTGIEMIVNVYQNWMLLFYSTIWRFFFKFFTYPSFRLVLEPQTSYQMHVQWLPYFLLERMPPNLQRHHQQPVFWQEALCPQLYYNKSKQNSHLHLQSTYWKLKKNPNLWFVH